MNKVWDLERAEIKFGKLLSCKIIKSLGKQKGGKWFYQMQRFSRWLKNLGQPFKLLLKMPQF